MKLKLFWITAFFCLITADVFCVSGQSADMLDISRKIFNNEIRGFDDIVKDKSPSVRIILYYTEFIKDKNEDGFIRRIYMDRDFDSGIYELIASQDLLNDPGVQREYENITLKKVQGRKLSMEILNTLYAKSVKDKTNLKVFLTKSLENKGNAFLDDFFEDKIFQTICEKPESVLENFNLYKIVLRKYNFSSRIIRRDDKEALTEKIKDLNDPNGDRLLDVINKVKVR